MCNIKLLDEEEEKKILLDTRRLVVCRTVIDIYNYYSKINIMGKWVRKCGFEPGDRLTVSAYKGRIVIEKEKPGTIDPKMLAREQKLAEEYVRERVRKLVSPEVFKQLSFKNGEISWIK
ncbi:hypothetical protein BAX97_11160 [Elizabethkingia meningoseptica]|uniref:SymE family type I addiction module toxin n=1 Tax=Elizabethkingia meningoseptica TaxID=238 RepID=UPI000998F0E5|nr:SymE family type I addiction module toxin [Elizabethkingia meningoseptica]OPC35439.1 hypothetical protein BAX97_11160 [Elizabethkingia meningoseptica]